MPRLIYSLIIYLAAPLAWGYFRWRARREPAYDDAMGQRFGATKDLPINQPLWIHCASVGEVQAALPLFNALFKRFPELPVHVTTMTPTGAELARQKLGDRVTQAYVPLDLPFATRKVMAHIKPRALLLLETELWPNLIAAATNRDIPVCIASARLTEKSVSGYARFPGKRLIAKTLSKLTAVMAQTEADRDRFVALGADTERTMAVGNLKFDLDISATQYEAATDLRVQIAGDRPVWIAASTHDGEETAALDAHKQILETYPDALLILVPRHPQRFDDVASLCAKSGLTFARRSTGGDWGLNIECYLADTMGELQMLYGCATVAFVGGTIAPIGGHNLLEPAAMGAAVVCGPYTDHCAEIAAELETNSALARIHNAEELGQTVTRLFCDADSRTAMISAGSTVLASNRGAVNRNLELIARNL